MATKVNFYENYSDKSARERAELNYSNTLPSRESSRIAR